MSFNLNDAPAGEAKGGFAFLEPDIYENGSLAEVKKETVPTKGGEEPLALAFYVADAKGQQHRHLEFEPSPGTEEKKILNKLARIKHIVRCFDEEEITAIDTGAKTLDFDGFDDLCNWVIDKIEATRAETSIDFKIVGNINNKTGKPFAGFPGYLGFMCVSGSGDALRFSTRELAQNKEYADAVAASQNTASDSDLVDQGEDGGDQDEWLTDESETEKSTETPTAE